MSSSPLADPGPSDSRRLMWGVLLAAILIVAAFIVLRLVNDIPHLRAGTLPAADAFDRRYVEHPAFAWAHIAPGAVYLLIAPFQVFSRFRLGSLPRHRAMGRVAVGAALITGLFGVFFGVVFPFGGALESSASVVFGAWFIWCVSRAVAAVRAGDVPAHRRWMLRGVGTALGIAAIRVIVGLGEGTGIATMDDSFGAAFWGGFALSVALSEFWVRRHPYGAAPTAA